MKEGPSRLLRMRSVPPGGPAGGDGASLRRILSYLRPHWRRTLGVLICIMVGTALGVIPPLLVRHLIDYAVPTGDRQTINLLVLGMVALPILAGLVGVLQQYLNTLVGQAIMSDLRQQLFQHLQRQSLHFYTTTPTGQMISRVTNDVAGVQSVVTGTLASVATNATTVLFTLVVIFGLNWKLSLVALCTVPAIIVPTRYVGRFRNRVSRETQEKQAEVMAYLQERLNISGYVLGRIFGRQRDEMRRFSTLNQELMGLQVKSAMVGRWFFMFVGILAAAGPALVYWYGGHQAVAQEITLGTVIAFVAYLTNLYRPMGQLANIYVDLVGALAVFERIFTYLDLVPDVDEHPRAVAQPPARGHIVFEHISFSYPSPPPRQEEALPDIASAGFGRGIPLGDRGPWGRGLGLGRVGRGDSVVPGLGSGGRLLPTPGHTPATEPVEEQAPPGARLALDDVSFIIEPGQLVALVGPSGAGKTTVTYLVPRFYDPTAGRVLLDGRDIRDATLDSLSTQIGMVTQESFLFHATIRENLLYAHPAAKEKDIIAACQAANIHDFISSLPQGYDTVVGERGFRLSGGEKQRVSIARAILKDPRILILDEATSSLDSTSEALIQAALEPLLRGRTSIVIAHRLSTILAADKILVLDKGRLVEQGTHEELLAGNGLYANLFHIQFRSRGVGSPEPGEPAR